MAKDYIIAYKGSIVTMVHRRALELIFCLGFFSVLTGLFLFSSPQVSFAQLSSSLETQPSQEVQGANELAELEAAREQYLSVWNNTAFTSQFDVFIAEDSVSLYGAYREHIPSNVFRPGETIVLYVEPVGYGHQPIADTSVEDVGNTDVASRTLYLLNMTADYIISDSTGSELQAIEDVPVAANLISHRQNLELFLTLTLRQDEPFPVGDYVVTYVVYDQVTGQSFQIDKRITIDENATTGALPVPGNTNDNSMQSLLPQQQLEEPSQDLET